MARNTSPDMWKQKAAEVEHLLRNGVKGEPRLEESLGYLSSLMYPLEGLQKQVHGSLAILNYMQGHFLVCQLLYCTLHASP